MASSQAVAKFFIYLVLSGHAHAFRIKRSFRPKEQSQTQAFPGTSPPTAEEKAKDEFYAKVKTFSTDPSMQLFGSGGQLSTFWLGLKKENKQLSLDALQDDVKDMLLGNTTRPNAVVELEEGINRWFEKRQKEHPDQTKYKNCGFSFAPLISDMRRDIGPDELAKVAPAAFVNVNQTEKPCEFGTTFNQTLAKHTELANHAIKFANWFVGKGKSNSSKEDLEQDFQNLEAPLTQATALLEVKPANMQDRPFDPVRLAVARPTFWLLVFLSLFFLFLAWITAGLIHELDLRDAALGEGHHGSHR